MTGEVICSGVVVAPACVVTAAHCVEGGTAGMTFFVGPSIGSPLQESAILATQVNPSWAGLVEHDLAVVRLAQAVATPVMPLGSPPGIGAATTVVGFGTNGTSSGTKRTAVVELVFASSTELMTDGTSANVCDGDSGGPLLANLSGILTVVGIAAATDDGCDEVGLWARVDGADRSFVDTAVAAICTDTVDDIYVSGFEPLLPDLGWAAVVPATLMCTGRCFTFVPGSECQCDELCLERGDCCLDLCSTCGPCE